MIVGKEEERRERSGRGDMKIEEKLEVSSIGQTVISEYRCTALSKQRNI
jgi:hypothetical protein